MAEVRNFDFGRDLISALNKPEEERQAEVLKANLNWERYPLLHDIIGKNSTDSLGWQELVRLVSDCFAQAKLERAPLRQEFAAFSLQGKYEVRIGQGNERRDGDILVKLEAIPVSGKLLLKRVAHG